MDRTGDAFTLVTGEDEMMVRTIERLIGSRLERRQLEGFDYGAYAKRIRSPAPIRPGRSGPTMRRGGRGMAHQRDPFAPTPKLYQSNHREIQMKPGRDQ